MPRSKRKAHNEPARDAASDEWWTIVQVASCLSIPYQSARNRMLEGRFGESQYDAKTRCLTVLAARVHAYKNAKFKRSKSRTRHGN